MSPWTGLSQGGVAPNAGPAETERGPGGGLRGPAGKGSGERRGRAGVPGWASTPYAGHRDTDRDPVAHQDVRRSGHRAGRPHRRRRARDHRPGGRERRRQIHLDQDSARPDRTNQRSGLGARHRPDRRPGGCPQPGRLHAGARLPPTGPVRRRTGHPPRPDERPAPHRGSRAGLGGAAARRALRGALPPGRWLLDRHEAARQAGPGAGARPRPAAARRADQRPGPGRPRRHAGPGAPDRHRVRHLRAGLLAPARARWSGSATR